MSFAAAEAVADAVLYEGYALYPYRAGSAKNRVRFQWGVLVPPGYAAVDPSERWHNTTQTLLEQAARSRVRIRVRFLHLMARRLEAGTADGGWQAVDTLDLGGGGEVLSVWDEATEQQIDLEVTVEALVVSAIEHPFNLEGAESTEQVATTGGGIGRVIRRRQAVAGVVRVAAEPLPGPYGVWRLTVRVENRTPGDPPSRDEALRLSLVSCHTLLAADTGSFISLLAPPQWAQPYVEQTHSDGTYPVLVGPDNGRQRLVLSSPIILYDHPATAPESPGDLFDATEIDEILTLRTMTLTDEEKRQARGTDARTAAIIDHVDHLPPEMLERLHGAIRMLAPGVPAPAAERAIDPTPWWDPGADAAVSPDTDHVVIDGTAVARGSRVRLHPRLGGADAQDMFLDGLVAVVEAVFEDVDGERHLAVTIEGDPAADQQRLVGRYRYFKVDEVQPLPAGEVVP